MLHVQEFQDQFRRTAWRNSNTNILESFEDIITHVLITTFL